MMLREVARVHERKRVAEQALGQRVRVYQDLLGETRHQRQERARHLVRVVGRRGAQMFETGSSTATSRHGTPRRRPRPRVAGPPRGRASALLIHKDAYARLMSANVRVERGWILVNGARQDDGTIKLGTGSEMRISPFEAVSERAHARITWGDILKASVQRLAFWRR